MAKVGKRYFTAELAGKSAIVVGKGHLRARWMVPQSARKRHDSPGRNSAVAVVKAVNLDAARRSRK